MPHDDGNCPEVYAQGSSSFEKGVYRRKAAGPVAAAIPGMAVGIDPPAFELEEDPVTAEAADDAAELAFDASLLALDKAELKARLRTNMVRQ